VLAVLGGSEGGRQDACAPSAARGQECLFYVPQLLGFFVDARNRGAYIALDYGFFFIALIDSPLGDAR
jgi:hypothetical protein